MSEADGCDGALWGIVVKETKEEVVKEVATTIYNFKDKSIEPGDFGFKYSILTMKEKDAEYVQAYIGDVELLHPKPSKSWLEWIDGEEWSRTKENNQRDV